LPPPVWNLFKKTPLRLFGHDETGNLFSEKSIPFDVALYQWLVTGRFSVFFSRIIILIVKMAKIEKLCKVFSFKLDLNEHKNTIFVPFWETITYLSVLSGPADYVKFKFYVYRLLGLSVVPLIAFLYSFKELWIIFLLKSGCSFTILVMLSYFVWRQKLLLVKCNLLLWVLMRLMKHFWMSIFNLYVPRGLRFVPIFSELLLINTRLSWCFFP
jgi:hypothetical protein